METNPRETTYSSQELAKIDPSEIPRIDKLGPWKYQSPVSNVQLWLMLDGAEPKFGKRQLVNFHLKDLLAFHLRY